MRKIDFLAWKSDPVTKEIFVMMEHMREGIKDSLFRLELISKNDGLLEINRLSGYITALDDIVNISVEDDENNEEESDSE